MTEALDKELLGVVGLKKVSDNSYFVAKQNQIVDFEKNKYYIIHIDESDTAKDLLDVTRLNWNNGKYLISNYLKCELVLTQGNMVCINACGYNPELNQDLDDIYLNFWINRNIITIIKILN